MSNKETLEKAFLLAVNNGFRQRDEEPDLFRVPEAFIYRHEFARALWGDWKTLGHSTTVTYQGNKSIEPLSLSLPVWQYHLQMMVIAPDPIKYLGENI